jgi:hypothetical protein
MRDDELDAWLEAHAKYEEATSIGYTTYALGRRGGSADERVGFVKPDDLPHPSRQDVKRFLAGGSWASTGRDA